MKTHYFDFFLILVAALMGILVFVLDDTYENERAFDLALAARNIEAPAGTRLIIQHRRSTQPFVCRYGAVQVLVIRPGEAEGVARCFDHLSARELPRLTSPDSKRSYK